MQGEIQFHAKTAKVFAKRRKDFLYSLRFFALYLLSALCVSPYIANKVLSRQLIQRFKLHILKYSFTLRPQRFSQRGTKIFVFSAVLFAVCT